MAYSFQSPQKSQIRYANHIKVSQTHKGYQIQEQIGKGGFGVVYRATSQTKGSMGKELAIKMINKQEMRKLKLTKRVANEVEIHWQLRHASILELYNYFEDSEYVYMVMEICENGNLFQFLKEHPRGCLSEPETRGILLQLIYGLQYLHSNGIIHRDLKLSNLLLNSKYELKIADFGLAVKLQDPLGEQKTMCGTPNYISPEIVSRMPYGLASDMWALGCMMVTLLTGKPPFESGAVKNTLDRVVKADYTLPDTLSRESKDLISRLLQKVLMFDKEPKNRIHLNQILKHSFFNHLNPIKGLEPPQITFTPPTQRSNTIEPNQGSDLPCFNMHRLKQIVQSTKHGKMEILHDLRLLVDFSSDSEILLISSDGSAVSIFSRSMRLSVDSPLEKYKREQLPGKYHKKFRYASRFVDLVRSKTPKVVYYSPMAKVSLMENQPLGDIIASFYSGAKVTLYRSKNQLEIKISRDAARTFQCIGLKEQKDGSFVYSVQLSKHSDIDPAFQQLFEHTKRCLQHCLDAEKENVEDGKYPVIIKSNQSPSKNVLRPQSPSTSIHPSVNTFSTSFQDSKSVAQRPKSRIEDRPPLQRITNKVPIDLQRSKASLQNSGFVSSGPTTQTDFQPKFLDSIGWCVQMPDKRFSMLFNDGVQVIMNPKTHSLAYVGESISEYLCLT